MSRPKAACREVVARRLHAAVSTATVAVLVVGLGACSDQTRGRTAATLAAQADPAATSAGGTERQDPGATEPALTAPVTTAQLEAAGLLEPPERDGSAVATPSGTVVSDEYGSYTRLALADGAPEVDLSESGPWSAAVARFGAAYVAEMVRLGAQFVVEDVVDSALRWEDGDAAWSQFNDDLAAVLTTSAASNPAGRFTGDLDPELTPDREPNVTNTLFDVGRWRQARGLSPAPVEAGASRTWISWLSVSQITSWYAGPDDSYRPWADDDSSLGLEVSYDVRYSESVLTDEGTTYTLSEDMSVRIGLPAPRGGWSAHIGSDGPRIGLTLTGGMSALPVLATTPGAIPDGWTTRRFGHLTYAAPSGQGLAITDSGYAGTSRWVEYRLDPTSDDDESGPTGGRAGTRCNALTLGRSRRASDDEGDGWVAVHGFDNYGLVVPGAQIAAAESGRETDGCIETRIFLVAGDTTYKLAWISDTKPTQQEVAQIVGTLSVDS